MDSRWLLLGYGLLFAALTLGFISQRKALLAFIGVVHTVFGIGGFWWNTTHDNPIETRFSRSR